MLGPQRTLHHILFLVLRFLLQYAICLKLFDIINYPPFRTKMKRFLLFYGAAKKKYKSYLYLWVADQE